MTALRFLRSRPDLDPDGLATLGARWRGLEAAAAASPFQRWAWVGCRAVQRYPDPVLVEARAGDALVGLALFNRRHGRLWLHESGDPALDAVYIEHNGPLVRPGPDAACIRAGLLRCARAEGHLVLSGVGPDTFAAARDAGAPAAEKTRAALFVDLRALRPEVPLLDALSRNARQQLRRSARAYGPARIERPASRDEALAYLDALIDLHTASWTARGRPGAFATPAIRAFHRELIAAGTGEAELLRVVAGGAVVGYLYNLRAGGWVCAYQSGFDYAAAPPHGKPGLLCHVLAIEAGRAGGADCYDFMAGDARYKATLANASRPLHWLRLLPRWHPRALAEPWLRRLHISRAS